MALNRRSVALLAILSVLLTALAVKRLYLDRIGATAEAVADTGGSSSSAGRVEAARPAAAPVSRVPDVDLARLAAPRPAPESAARDPFRFRPKAPPPPPPMPAGRGLGAPAGVDTGPPPPPPVPPIPLRLTGFIAKPGLKLAVWIDNNGNTFFGKEGDIIDGRYRIVKIGVESADIAWADGRGRPERKTISVR
jgi:hypothetical protein